MSSTRRDVLVFFASVPAACLVGCSSSGSGGSSATTPIDPDQTAAPENPFEVVDTPDIGGPATETPPDVPETPDVDAPAVEPPATSELPLIDASSGQARALEWEVRSTRSGQNCAGCALYQGAPGAATGGCVVFPGSATASGAWCTAYVPRSN